MSNKTILIVDDSRVSRMLIKGMVLEHRPDWEIIEAADGDDALSKTESAEIDIMIIDYNMPGMTGLTLAGKLKERFPGVPISLLTANIQESIRKKAEEGGIGFEEKPITESKIQRIISLLGE